MFKSADFNFDGGDRLIQALSGNSGALNTVFESWAGIYSTFVRRKYKENSAGGGEWPDLADSTKAARAREADAAKVQIREDKNGRGGGGRGGSGGTTKRKKKKNSDEFTEEAEPKKKKRESGGGGGGGEAKKFKQVHPGGRTFAILINKGILWNALNVGAVGNLTEIVSNGVIFGFADVEHPGAQVTIRDIATFHDEGMGNNPVRIILQMPTEEVINRMLMALKIGCENLARGGNANAGGVD